MKKTLTELRNSIEKEVDFVDVKPYSHNIISCLLQQIDKDFGKKEANRAIIDFELNELGWHIVK